MTLEFADSDNL